MKTEKLGGVAGGEGECGDDVAGWLVREIWSLDILPVKKEAKLSASEVPGEVVGSTSLQTDNHISTPPLSLLQAGFPSCCPKNTVKALKAQKRQNKTEKR